MDIANALEPREGILSVPLMRYAPPSFPMEGRGAVQEESLLDVEVNGRWNLRLSCSLGHVDELVAGRLYTSGLIDGTGEIGRMTLRSDPLEASVTVARLREGRATVAEAQRLVEAGVLLNPVEPIAWDVPSILRLAAVFAEDKTSHRRTRGVHSAYLAQGDELLCWREDIGRHNAFDKVVGWALMNGVDLARCTLYTSGRVPSDMAAKAVRARIPVLVSKATATDKAVALARNYGLALVCDATPYSLAVLNGVPCAAVPADRDGGTFDGGAASATAG